MNLLVTSIQRLRAMYGTSGAAQVFAALARLQQARGRRRIASRLLLVEDGLPGLAIAGVAVAAAPIAAQLTATADVLRRGGSRLASVLIIGGPEVIPFVSVPNPTPADGDAQIAGDHGYTRRDAHLVPEWAVGRLPGAAGSDPALLVRLILGAAALHLLPPEGAPQSFGYSAAAWASAATTVYATLGSEPPLLSPPVIADTLDVTLLARARRVYCNLHGVRDGPLWYGQPTDRRGLVVALRPTDIAPLNLRGAVVATEACYGAAVSGRTESTSMALAFLARGAAGFLGATAITYGPAAPPLGEADLIVLFFLRALQTPNASLGEAFVAALTGMITETLARQPALDDDDRKTALAFVLYGDPTLRV